MRKLKSTILQFYSIMLMLVDLSFLYRYKEVIVKKCSGYTEIWLSTNSKMKNALNLDVCVCMTPTF